MNRYATFEEAQAACPGVGYVVYKSDFACDPYVVEALPRLGEEVSMTFNGDYTPCGKITRIAKNHAFVETENGTRFHRKGDNKFVVYGCYSMVRGSRNAYNAEF